MELISKKMLETSCCAKSDEVIWRAFKNGDKAALASLYQRYFDILIHYAIKISSDKDLIKDCIHDLFVEIWNNKLRLAEPQSVKAYLLSCIQRKLIRQLKHTRTSQLEIYRLPTAEVVDSTESQIIADQHQTEQNERLRRALKELTKRQQEAVYLKFYANLSYPEISGVMDIGTDSVYNLVSKAIDVLERKLPGTRK